MAQSNGRQQAVRPAGGWLKGFIKEVPSGDTLVIQGTQFKPGTFPPEKRITLSSLIAPRLARRDGSTKDEAFAWQSREFLRKKCAGKVCAFKQDYSVESISRDFCSVFLDNENVGLAVVSNGWAKVRQGPPNQSSPDMEALLAAEQTAITQAKGMHTKDAEAQKEAVRDIPIGDFDAEDFIRQAGKGVRIPASVDSVMNGGAVRVQFGADLNYRIVPVLLCGVACPRMNVRQGDQEGAPEPYAREAKYFTELKTLNRDIEVQLDMVDHKNGSIFGQVLYHDKEQQLNLATQLLMFGLAKMQDWSASFLPGGATSLREAEKAAKQQRLRLWQGYKPPATSTGNLASKFKGPVVEAVSGDTLVVLDEGSMQERKVSMSSIRAPRSGPVGKAEPWGIEAKELLRKRCVGKIVEVTVEYGRKVPPGPNAPEGTGDIQFWMANIEIPGRPGGDKVAVNLGELQVSKGYATVVKHRQDEERSSIYDRLAEAEKTAQTQGVGLHGQRPAEQKTINDLSKPGNQARAQQYMGSFKRAGRVNAVCEHVMAGHRVRLSVPSMGVTIAFAPAGVKSPAREQPARNGKPAVKGEPYAEEALRFTRRHFLQRDVEIEVGQCDKGGTFLGELFVPADKNRNLGLNLLEAGYGKLHPRFDPDRDVGGHQLMEAQERAQQQRVKIWENYTPEVPAETSAAAEQEDSGPPGGEPVTVTEVVTGSRLYLQKVNDTRLEKLEKDIAELDIGPPEGKAVFSKGSLCLAQFTADDRWYRAYIDSVGNPASPSPTYQVIFIDYGNREPLRIERLRSLPVHLKSVPPLAHEATLALLKVPPISSDIGYEAAAELSNTTQPGAQRRLNAVVVKTERAQGKPAHPLEANGKLHVLLYDEAAEGGESVNAQLLQQGYAQLVQRRTVRGAAAERAYDEMEKYQNEAREKHLNLWQYGDPGSDDES